VAVARALIDEDKLLIADATSRRLGHRAMVRKLTVKGCAYVHKTGPSWDGCRQWCSWDGCRMGHLERRRRSGWPLVMHGLLRPIDQHPCGVIDPVQRAAKGQR